MSFTHQSILWLLLFIGFFGQLALSAQVACPGNVFVLDSLQASYYLEDAMEILLDEKHNLDFTDAQRAEANFQPFSQYKERFRTPFSYWGRVCIKNQLDPKSSPSEWVLLFSNKLTKIDIFISDSLSSTNLKTGEFLPIHEKAFMKTAGNSIVKVTIPPGSRRSLYFRAESEIGQSLKLAGVWLRPLELQLRAETRMKKSNGFFMGFFFMMMSYSLALAFFTKDKAYLFYSGYLSALIVWQSFNTGELGEWLTPLLFPEHPQYIYFFKLATYLGIFSYLAFVSSFLDMQTLLPKWHRLFKWIIWLGVPLLIVDAAILWTTNFSLLRADRLSVVYILLFIVVTCIFLWPLYKTKDKKGQFILAGILAMNVGLLLTAISRFSPSNFTLGYFQAGIFIELLAFSLGLAFRRRLMLKENQEKAIELEKNRMQRQANEKEAKRWRELNELKNRLYGNFTHEFRTPLMIIKGTAEQLAGNDRKKEMIVRNSDELLEMVSQMLDLSKLEAGEMGVDWVQGDVIQFLKIHVDTWQPLASGKNLSLFFYSKAETCTMDYDAEKLRQVLYNLLSNALKFTPEFGEVVVAVSVLQNAHLEVTVKDTGKGIPEDHLDKIFNRFYQLDDSATRRTGGTGIGLALVKELVELMEGHISVESKVGRGTAFSVRLPIHQRAPLAERSVSPVMAKGPQPQLAVSPERHLEPNGERPHLLVVEDNIDVQEYLKSLLEKEYCIATAANGAAAIRTIGDQLPDLILCDVMMPEMDGMEFCEKIKTDERTAHIPVVMLTARATQKDKLDGLEHGADAYLIKPFDKQELLLCLHNLLALKAKMKAFLLRPGEEQESGNGFSEASRTLLEAARTVILKNMDSEYFGVVHLARGLSLSKSTLTRRFKETAGISPGHFIQYVRLHEARQLLEAGELTVSEVAYSVGYSHPSHFSTAYKSFFGISPSETPK
ncbi:MAG: ATP-binding protein [bacterium]|nr:ATP-binding protein [bacterium]